MLSIIRFFVSFRINGRHASFAVSHLRLFTDDPRDNNQLAAGVESTKSTSQIQSSACFSHYYTYKVKLSLKWAHMRLCDLLLACVPDSWNLFTYEFADRLLCSGIVEWAQAFARLQVLRHLCHAVVDEDA
jgi:hypothetical protein